MSGGRSESSRDQPNVRYALVTAIACGPDAIALLHGAMDIISSIGSMADPQISTTLSFVCHRHHRMVQENNWQIAKTDDSRIIAIAPTVTFGLPPRLQRDVTRDGGTD